MQSKGQDGCANEVRCRRTADATPPDERFPSGLTCIASHAGCSAASTATATPLPSASRSSRIVKSPHTKIDRRKQIADCFADRDQRGASKQPAEHRADERTCKREQQRFGRESSRSSSPRFMPRQRSVPISFLRWITDTETVL